MTSGCGDATSAARVRCHLRTSSGRVNGPATLANAETSTAARRGTGATRCTARHVLIRVTIVAASRGPIGPGGRIIPFARPGRTEPLLLIRVTIVAASRGPIGCGGRTIPFAPPVRTEPLLRTAHTAEPTGVNGTGDAPARQRRSGVPRAVARAAPRNPAGPGKVRVPSRRVGVSAITAGGASQSSGAANRNESRITMRPAVVPHGRAH